jgi:hypothetical protein
VGGFRNLGECKGSARHFQRDRIAAGEKREREQIPRLENHKPGAPENLKAGAPGPWPELGPSHWSCSKLLPSNPCASKIGKAKGFGSIPKQYRVLHEFEMPIEKIISLQINKNSAQGAPGDTLNVTPVDMPPPDISLVMNSLLIGKAVYKAVSSCKSGKRQCSEDT